MSDEINSDQPVAGPTKNIKEVGMLDLRYAKTPADLSDIASISEVGVILISQDLVGALGRIDINEVGAIVPIPDDGKVSCFTGQTRLTGELFESGDSETSLILVGQTFITTPVRKVGYKEIRVHGQLFAIRGSEAAISAKLTSLSGQNFFLPEGARLIMGQESIGQEFLELLQKPTAFVIMGELNINADVSKELLMEKIEEIVLMGCIRAPAHLIPALQVITKEKLGEIKPHDA